MDFKYIRPTFSKCVVKLKMLDVDPYLDLRLVNFTFFFALIGHYLVFARKKLLCKTYQKIISLSPVTFKFKISQTQTNMETESNEIPIHWQTSLKCDNTSSRDRRSYCKEGTICT